MISAGRGGPSRRSPALAPGRARLVLALGLAGIHAANLLRLALVGARWGAEALQEFHRHAGRVLFLAWMVAFWALVPRRFEGAPPGGRA